MLRIYVIILRLNHAAARAHLWTTMCPAHSQLQLTIRQSWNILSISTKDSDRLPSTRVYRQLDDQLDDQLYRHFIARPIDLSSGYPI